MEENPLCSVCHAAVRPTDYFCFNCGKNLHLKLLSTSIGSQLVLYVKTILLMPFGIVWGVRYLKQPNRASKLVGLTAIAITIILLVVITKYTVDLVNTVNEQVTQQLKSIQGF